WCAFVILVLFVLGFGFFSAVVSCAVAAGHSKRDCPSICQADIRYSDLKIMAGQLTGSIHLTHQNIAVPVSISDGDLQIFRSEFAAKVYENCHHRLGDILEIREGSHAIAAMGDGVKVPMIIDSSMDRFKEPAIGIGFLGNISQREFHTGDRFVLRKTGDQLVCAMVPTEDLAFAHQNVYVCKPIPAANFSAISICALLTSSIMNRLYQDGPLGQKGRPMAQLRIVGLKNLPIPTIEVLRASVNKLESVYRLRDMDAIDSVVSYIFKESGITL
ncbi:MAG: hypothetical protein RBT84_19570, partial [FCB group bacterium]|nr:hypothetical protein [FCB group bacterium]